MEEYFSSFKFQSMCKDELGPHCIKHEEVNISEPLETIRIVTCEDVNMTDNLEELSQSKPECSYDSNCQTFGIKTENETHEMNCITAPDGIKLDKIDIIYTPVDDLRVYVNMEDKHEEFSETKTEYLYDSSCENFEIKMENVIPEPNRTTTSDGVELDKIDIVYAPVEELGTTSTPREETSTRKNAEIVPQPNNKVNSSNPNTTFIPVSNKSLNVNVYECNVCSFTSKRKNNLNRHMLIHSDPSESERLQIFKCNICTYETRNKQQLNTHMLTHLGSPETETFKCDVCDYATLWKDSLSIHRLIHVDTLRKDTYTCDECVFRTKWKDDLKRHITIHRDPLELQMYRCTICNYKAKGRQHLNSHMLLHLDPSERNGLRGKAYKCGDCDHAAASKYLLKKHRVIHKLEIYLCDICGYKSEKKYDLKMHMLVHQEPSEMKTYKCPKCDFFESKYENQLKIHLMLKHVDSSEKKMYACGVCDFTTHLEDQLNSHRVVHEDGTETGVTCDKVKE